MKLIPLKNKVKTIATVSFMNKVKVLCSKIRDVEWSGVLFYSVKGSISNPEKLTITLEDILLMDKGTKTLTEYNFDNDESLAMDLVDLLQKSDTHRLTYKRGLIHSHNTMPVFFSGTDNEELINGAITHNYYLSVIVNSFGDITGKISFKSKTESKIKIISSDEKGKSIVKYRTAKEEVIHSYDCEIEDMTTVINNDFGFLERIDFIIEKRKLKEEEERKKNVITQPSFLKNENKNQFKNENYFGKTRNDYVFPNSNFNPKSSTTSIADAILGIEDDDLLSDDDVIVNINSEQINFAGYCLNDKNLELKSNGECDIEEILQDILMAENYKQNDVITRYITNYFQYVESYYNKKEDEITSEFLIETLNTNIAIYKQYDDYRLATQLATYLELFIENLNK